MFKHEDDYNLLIVTYNDDGTVSNKIATDIDRIIKFACFNSSVENEKNVQ